MKKLPKSCSYRKNIKIVEFKHFSLMKAFVGLWRSLPLYFMIQSFISLKFVVLKKIILFTLNIETFIFIKYIYRVTRDQLSIFMIFLWRYYCIMQCRGRVTASYAAVQSLISGSVDHCQTSIMRYYVTDLLQLSWSR